MTRYVSPIGIIITIAILCGFGSLAPTIQGGWVQQFSPTSFAVYSSHKANITVDTRTIAAIKYAPNATGATLKLNGTGTAILLTKDAESTLWINQGVSSVVFGVASSGLTAKTKINVQLQ